MNSNFNDELNNKNNNSILVVTEDLETIKSLKDGFNNKYNVTYFYNDKFYLLDGDINSFDLIIFDNTKNLLSKFIDVFKLTKTYDFNIPMIVLQNEVTQELSTLKCANSCMILEKKVDNKFLLLNVEIIFNFVYANKKVQFENGFSFDVNKELLLQGKKVIKLTKIEKKLVNLLALNPNVLVTYEDISKIVWKGKEFSIYSLRNVVKHIREKTDETFIKNSSNRGYVITTI